MTFAPAGSGHSMNGTHVGFSGTSRGMTDGQLDRTMRMLSLIANTQPGPHWLHHGDCVGSDAQAHRIARRFGYHVYLHPPISNEHRAFCDWDQRDPIMEFLQRDNEIARWSHHLLLATPRERTEVVRSGTWSTVRYALARSHAVIVIPPFGDQFMYEESVV